MPGRFKHFLSVSDLHCLWVQFLELCDDLSDNVLNFALVGLVGSCIANHLPPLNSLVLASEETDYRAHEHVTRKVHTVLSHVFVLLYLSELGIVLKQKNQKLSA